ncbi:MAG: GTPase HflX, partial [Oscillospiraceae bacterium]|nr:GTPase HflX [Oscillospiraceae bacterium]
MNENEKIRQRAVLVGIDTGEYDLYQSLDELTELADTAGADVIGRFTQNRDGQDNATYIGGGKLKEIRDFCRDSGAELLIFDGELSGSQLRNIEDITEVQAVDRTMLILDIFAQRATSSEGKLQVELAQQKYLLPRLIGVGTALSRQGGGIGTRGPGETKLESDRRHIRRRINALEQELKELEKRRALMRRRRSKNEVPVIAIVGYTNVGKSTLLNKLTGSEIYVQDQLFATLDPTARELILPDGQHAVIIDTVGLVQRLPHQLVEAFKSTLEVAASADVILNVCDYTNPLSYAQLDVTNNLLAELGCGDIPVITVYNKIDRSPVLPEPDTTERVVHISAKEGIGLDRLLQDVCACLSESVERLSLLLPYSEGSLLDLIRRNGRI